MKKQLVFLLTTVFLVSSNVAAQSRGSWEQLTADGKAALGSKEYAEARKRFEAAVKVAEKFGANDLRLATSLGNLASAIDAEEGYVTTAFWRKSAARRKAIKLYERAFHISEKAGAPESQKLAYARALADDHWAQHEFDKAQRYLELLAEAYEKDPTSSAEAAARFSEFISDLYLQVPRQTVTTSSTVPSGSSDWPTGPIAGASARRAMQGSADSSGRVSAPDPSAVAAASRGGVMSPYPRGTTTTSTLSTSRVVGGPLKTAVSFRERGLRIRDRVAPSDIATHQSRMTLAGLYLLQGNVRAAKESYQTIVGNFESSTAPEPKLHIWALTQLAAAQQALKERPAAKDSLQRAIAVAENSFGADGLEVVPPLLAYAKVLRSEKRTAEAEKLEARAKQIQAKVQKQVFGAPKEGRP